VTVDAFARYADTIVKAFGGQVKNWITLNEIRCFTLLAYAEHRGNKAPGRKVSTAMLNQTYHHALLCHGHGVRAVRAYGGAGARVGLTDNCEFCVPVTETPDDIAAAKEWFIGENIHLLGAIHRGSYAPEYLAQCGADAPRVAAGDFDLISLPTDFLGLNLYTATFVRAGEGGKPQALAFPAHYPQADSPWLQLIPQTIYWATRCVKEVYGVKAIYITENGCGYNDEPVLRGEVIDLHRRDFLRNYLRETHRAIADGVPIRGYFLWSFMDNFEWEDGYLRRFGIVHVDFETQVRTPKLSARYFTTVMRENRIV
jgi:beta-glucosidase